MLGAPEKVAYNFKTLISIGRICNAVKNKYVILLF